MAQDQSSPDSREQRVDEVIAAYLQAEAAGRSPDRAEIVARHPDLAADLQSFFADHDRFRRLSPDIRQALLIGHNEGLAEAAIALATAGDPAALASLHAKFPTGAVAWLRFPMEDWTHTGRTPGELLAFVRPRDLSG